MEKRLVGILRSGGRVYSRLGSHSSTETVDERRHRWYRSSGARIHEAFDPDSRDVDLLFGIQELNMSDDDFQE